MNTKQTMILTLVLLLCSGTVTHGQEREGARPVPIRVDDLPEEKAPVPTRVDDLPEADVPPEDPAERDEEPIPEEPGPERVVPELVVPEDRGHTPFDEPIRLRMPRSKITGDPSDEIIADLGDQVPLRRLNFWVGLGGGFVRTTRRQHEAKRHAQWANLSVTITYNVGSIETSGRPIHVRVGGSLEADYGTFHSSRVGRYSGNWMSGKVALVLGFRHGDTNDSPGVFDAEFKFGVGSRPSDGEVGRGSAFQYEADRRADFAFVATTIRFLWPLYGVGTDADAVRIWGEKETKLIHGFLPFVEVYSEYQNAFSNKADTTVTDAGGRDAQRDNQFQAKVTLGAYRFLFLPWGNPVEVTPYVGAGLQWRMVYGFQTIRNDHSLVTLNARLGVRTAITRRVFTDVEGFYGWELNKNSEDHNSGVLLNVGFSF